MDVKIALLAGDGIGPEIVAEATKVLDRVAEKFGHKIEYRPALVGAAAIDAVGDPYPDETHAVCLAAASTSAVRRAATRRARAPSTPAPTRSRRSNGSCTWRSGWPCRAAAN